MEQPTEAIKTKKKARHDVGRTEGHIGHYLESKF